MYMYIYRSIDRYMSIDLYLYIYMYMHINVHLRSKLPDFVMPPAEAVAAVVRIKICIYIDR